jgi:hypothetical protein
MLYPYGQDVSSVEDPTEKCARAELDRIAIALLPGGAVALCCPARLLPVEIAVSEDKLVR